MGDIMQTATVQESTSAKIRFCMLLAPCRLSTQARQAQQHHGRQDGRMHGRLQGSVRRGRGRRAASGRGGKSGGVRI